jgi:mono/diheme cytochrome c family protein
VDAKNNAGCKKGAIMAPPVDFSAFDEGEKALRESITMLEDSAEKNPFRLSRIATLFGFYVLASGWPYCASADDEIARGKYIVEDVAKCAICHSPRDQNGEFVKELWLGGAKLDFKPITPNIGWPETAPNIRGMKGYSEKSAIILFSRGIAVSGIQPAWPMPQYKMNEDDARAVYEYLKSLAP